MGLLDLVKSALGTTAEPAKPSVAAITIISSGPATPTSKTQSSKAQA